MSARIKYTVKNYSQALQFLNGKHSRKYAHNTYVQKNPDMEQIGVFYHGNRIVTFYPDSVSFSSCGWHTSTTKERINWFLPDGFHVYQENWDWYLVQRSWKNDAYSEDNSWSFMDGITITNDKVENDGQ